MSADSDPQAELDRLAEEYVARARRGERPSISEYARAHPQYAADIEDIFPLLNAMEEIKSGSEGPMPGTRIGPYEIVREIGRGGMGVVYEAVQSELGRRVALKILPTQATMDPRFLDRFRLEAQAAARLKHPHIVPVIGYGNDDGVHYYSMQYIEGRGVDVLIRETAARLGDDPGGDRGSSAAARAWFQEAAGIGLQATEAITHAHAHGVLHRDIKPSNLLMDDHGGVWVTDFGLCSEEGSEGLTATGDLLGTFRYMPPERFSGSSDVRGDVYGIGITLYEMLTRRKAYQEESRPALAARIVKEGPKRPRSIDARLPADLETLVRKAMAHDPEQRYATAEALAADLRAYLDGRPIAARAPTFGYLLRSAIRRHKPLAATLTIAVLLLVVSSVFYIVDLKEKEARARLGQYAATIAAVESALRARDAQRASGLLEEAPAEYRNWEWRHLESRLEHSLRKFESRPVAVHDVAYHPAGAHFAAVVGREIWIYADETGQVLEKLTPEKDPSCVRWSPQGDRLAVGTSKALEIWSWPVCERVFLSAPGGEHRSVEFAAGGDVILSGVVEGAVICYDGVGAGELYRAQLPTRVLSLACLPARTSDRVFVGTGDGRVRMLRRSDLAPLWSLEVSGHGVHTVAFLSEERVAYSTLEGLLRVQKAANGDEVRTWPLGEGGGRIIIDPTGRRLLVLSIGEVHVYDEETGRLLHTLAGSSRPARAAVHPEGRRVVVATSVGTIREWYLGDGGDPLLLSRHMDDILGAALDADGRFAASGGFGGEIRVWEIETGELARVLYGHAGVVLSVRFSRDGRWLASSDDEGEIIIWDRATGRRLRRWRAGGQAVSHLAFLSDDSRLISAGQDASIRSWDPSTGQLLDEADMGEAAPTSMTVGSGGQVLATGDMDGRLRLWSARTLKPLRELTGHLRAVRGLAFHPSESLLASVSDDQTLRIWDPTTGAQVRGDAEGDPELGWSEGLRAVAFSPDGSRIAAGSYSGTIRLWDTKEVRLMARLKRDWSWIMDVEFSPDGSRLITALSSGSVRIWDSVPRRERVAAYERAALHRARARPIVQGLAATHAAPEQLLRLLADVRDEKGLDPEVYEAALRLVHQRSATHEAFVARMWRDLSSPDADPDDQLIAFALARGLWRTTRHLEQQDARCDTLMGVAWMRRGEPRRALRIFELIGHMNEERAPALFAVDLAVLALSHVALEDAGAAQAALERLDAHLRRYPEADTTRARAFRGEARAALAALSK